MKWIGQILVFVSLTTGALSAASSYHAWLDLPDDQLAGLTLNDGAGVVPDENNQDAPRFEKGHELSGDDIAALRQPQPTQHDGSVRLTAVRVKEFSFSRWQHKWGLTVFVLSMIGMVTGSLLTRYAAKRRRGSGALVGEASDAIGPDAALAAIVAQLDDLQAILRQQSEPHAREQIVIERVGILQQEQIPQFLETHEGLIERYGIGRTAEVMERFAAFERGVNRAWSAASDGDAEEATDSIAEAQTALEEARTRLKAL